MRFLECKMRMTKKSSPRGFYFFVPPHCVQYFTPRAMHCRLAEYFLSHFDHFTSHATKEALGPCPRQKEMNIPISGASQVQITRMRRHSPLCMKIAATNPQENAIFREKNLLGSSGDTNPRLFITICPTVTFVDHHPSQMVEISIFK